MLLQCYWKWQRYTQPCRYMGGEGEGKGGRLCDVISCYDLMSSTWC
jgi:hypothetical protein